MATKMNESSIIMALNKRSKLMNESKTCKESADGKYVYTCPECGYEYHCDEEFGDDTTVKCPGCGAQITKECGGTKGTKGTKKNESAPANPAGSDDEPDMYIMDQLYQCSECGDYFSSPVKFTGECTCPECGAVGTPNYIGEVEEVTESQDEADSALNEIQVKVTGGKVIKFTKAAKAGFKRIGGKYVKMTSKEKAARKKAGKQLARKGLGNKGAAKMKRRKSMKKRAKMNSGLNIEEGAVMELLNGVISDVMEHYTDTYYGFSVTAIKEATFDASTNALTLESTVTYEDNDTADATFVIEGFDTDELTVSESRGILNLEGLTMTGKGELTESEILVNEMSYALKIGNESFGESFYFDDAE